MIHNLLKKPRPFALILIVLLVLLTGLTGCGSNTVKTQSNASVTPSDSANNSSSGNTSSSTGSSSATSVKVTLYFPAPDASGLVPVERTVTVTNDEIIKAMFSELSNPPSGVEPALPKGTELLSATVKDGIATINLSKQFKSNFSGGATGEQLILYSIVDTLTTLSNVKSVQFLLDGAQTVTILKEFDTSSPLKRNESLIRKL
ncbi:GerMN domain-containing protein [Desulfitobacterium sp. AusDCA]|uniref:GerMN domain-containing protein n=1 Tax=Desulfitobacterium sp. AusDCA TaxID=3240383 RepID=UPI003DA6E0D9